MYPAAFGPDLLSVNKKGKKRVKSETFGSWSCFEENLLKQVISTVDNFLVDYIKTLKFYFKALISAVIYNVIRIQIVRFGALESLSPLTLAASFSPEILLHRYC
jgi:hypothetical protein